MGDVKFIQRKKKRKIFWKSIQAKKVETQVGQIKVCSNRDSLEKLGHY